MGDNLNNQPQNPTQATTVFVASGESRNYLHRILEERDQLSLRAFFNSLHVADIADVIEQSPSEDRKAIVELWGRDIDPFVLTELDEGVREEILEYVPYSVLARALKELDSDDLVHIIEDLESEKRDMILGALDRIDRDAVKQSLSFPEYTAGRLMRREFIIVPQHWNVGECIDFLRASEDLPEFFHSVFLVGPNMKPSGVVHISKIMGQKRDVLLQDVADEDWQVFQGDTPQEDVAYAFNQYSLLTAPVVDENGRILGVINIEDALEILDEEAEEDIKRLAGVGDEELNDGVIETTRLRFPWLLVNLITSILASIVIAQFADTINAIVALAVLMPIVASMGGNAGTQTLTVAVRAIATKDLTSANAFRIISREFFVGLANGLIFAIIIGLVGYFWFGTLSLGYVLAVAMVVNLIVAGLAGILIPMLLDRYGLDPALASGAFVTTVTDMVGFFVFLGLATVFLL